VQTVIDLSRGVDYLQSLPEVAGDRIGYLGFSMGAIIGAVFCGVEERIRCSALVVGGGNLRARFNEDDAEVIAENAAIVEPCNYVAMISPRPLLMINGTKDDVIGRAAAEALHNAAREPKRIVWYESGHYDLPVAEVVQELASFFDSSLGAPQSEPTT
jgi:dienelactone hydrolase